MRSTSAYAYGAHQITVASQSFLYSLLQELSLKRSLLQEVMQTKA
jgi:hypothetical protein